MSRDALDAAEEYSGGMDRLKSSLSSVSTFIGTELIKTLNEWIGKIQETIDGIKQLGRWLWYRERGHERIHRSRRRNGRDAWRRNGAGYRRITTEAAEEAAPAIEKMGNEVATATKKVAELTSTSRTGAEVIEAYGSSRWTPSPQSS